MRVTIVLLLVALAAHTHAKVYDRCELAWEFKCLYDIPTYQLADWVCLASAASGYNTALVTNVSGGKAYGLFQMWDTVWCKSSANSCSNECGIDCSRLTDYNIADDMACARKIYGRHAFEASDPWLTKCKGKNLASYTSGCNLTC